MSTALQLLPTSTTGLQVGVGFAALVAERMPLLANTIPLRSGPPSISTRAFHQASLQRNRPSALRQRRDIFPSQSPWNAHPGWEAGRGQASYTTEAAARVGEPTVHAVFERTTGTWQYVVVDPSTLAAVIIDPVLDYDPATQKIMTQTADALLSLVKEKGYQIERILETHVHADHLTAASYLQKRLVEQQGFRPLICAGKRIKTVQELFSQRYGVPPEEVQGVFDKLFDDDEVFDIGSLKATAMHIPGHTPDHLGYKVGDNVFCGDSIFHADVGTARCDFPGGSPYNLYASARKLLAMPGHVKVWTGHDYPPDGRSGPAAYMTVHDHKIQNKHVKDGIVEDEFVALRNKRDAALGAPRLLHQSLQMNIRAGRLPKPTAAGQHLLHLPLNLQGLKW